MTQISNDGRSLTTESKQLSDAVVPRSNQILHPSLAAELARDADSPVLIVLAAGKGTRFGKEPKCIQPIDGIPLARHSINAFRNVSSTPSICLVGYRSGQVARSLGDDNVYVLSHDPAGGTALAAYEAFAVEQLEEANPVVVVTMGDRIVPSSVFKELLAEHDQDHEADLTMLSAVYQLPRNQGKGRIVRDSAGAILRIVEQRDIDRLPAGIDRDRLQSQTEGNCPLYAIRARTLRRYLGQVRNDNAQQQFYFTDIVEAIRGDGGTVRSITIDPADPRYEILCADVTNREDLKRLDGMFTGSRDSVRNVARSIAAARPTGQIESIAAQLEEIARHAADEGSCHSDTPVGIGISGGRLRIAFMHPDMGRFFGPAWQMPIGAPDESSREQIVVLMQPAKDGLIRLSPTNPDFREAKNSISAHAAFMFPGNEIADVHSYEAFGTSMAESILAELGYVTEAQNEAVREREEAMPHESRWVNNNMRRPFSLVANAIASTRTLRDESVGVRVNQALGRQSFGGLNVISTGDIPRGGFSSSSAVTVATLNGLNSLFDLGIGADHLVDLACQAEYGTGVRAGALDQATEQKGAANQGTLISSNPRENYRIINTFPIPTHRFHVLFPYTVDRDRKAWRWSMGMYARNTGESRLTTSETRKMTGKAAEIAAILLRLPLDRDFFQEVEEDLVERGEMTITTALHVQDRLKSVPLLATQRELSERLSDNQWWYRDQLMQHQDLSRSDADQIARTTIESLLGGWRDPLLSRSVAGDVVNETGAPLRAMLGYLYGEVTKNCYLIHHPLSWIECVTQSQRGDRCFDIDPATLPDKRAMLGEFSWEKSVSTWKLMERWLERFDAQPFDFNAGLGDQRFSCESPVDLRQIPGTNFFRGLPLIDLAEAMLKRAFGNDAVAVRVNGAGQGDYFQLHVDAELADPEEVKDFIRIAFYERFALKPENEFVEPHPGGGAVGVKLDRYDQLPAVITELRRQAKLQRDQTGQQAQRILEPSLIKEAQ